MWPCWLTVREGRSHAALDDVAKLSAKARLAIVLNDCFARPLADRRKLDPRHGRYLSNERR
jgi:hypothetical protein